VIWISGIRIRIDLGGSGLRGMGKNSFRDLQCTESGFMAGEEKIVRKVSLIG
jgi:hypothetical protein